MLVIGVEGYAGHGKDTVADMLSNMAEADAYSSEKFSFAEPIKHICKYVFDMNDEEMYTEEGKKLVARNGYGLTNRKVLQLVGTECFRDIFDTNIWVDYMARQIDEATCSLALIPDTRFNNEAKWVDTKGFRIHVHDPRKEDLKEKDHASEAGTGIDPLFKIVNNGSLAELESKVRDLYITHISKLLFLEF